MKAYRSGNGDALMFRPDQNIERFHRSSIRMSLPVCISFFVSCDWFYLNAFPAARAFRKFLKVFDISQNAKNSDKLMGPSSFRLKWSKRIITSV